MAAAWNCCWLDRNIACSPINIFLRCIFTHVKKSHVSWFFKNIFAVKPADLYFALIMIEPISLEYQGWQIHSFRPEEFARDTQLIKEIYRLLTDQRTLQFLPKKRIHALAEAENWLKSAILNYYCGKNFIHLITEKATGKLAGVIDIMPPETSMEHYELSEYFFFVVFYLNSKVTGNNQMSSVLPLFPEAMLQQNVKKVGATVNRQNHAARKVLLRSGFCYYCRFDILQDLYMIDLIEQFPEVRQVG